jgi:hypothetical protein
MSTSQNLNRLSSALSMLWMLYNEEMQIGNVERIFTIMNIIKMVRHDMNEERERRLKNLEDHNEPQCLDLRLQTPS